MKNKNNHTIPHQNRLFSPFIGIHFSCSFVEYSSIMWPLKWFLTGRRSNKIQSKHLHARQMNVNNVCVASPNALFNDFFFGIYFYRFSFRLFHNSNRNQHKGFNVGFQYRCSLCRCLHNVLHEKLSHRFSWRLSPKVLK